MGGGGARRMPVTPRRRPAPPRTAELVIDEIGARGDGVGRLDGRPVFVPFTAAGDRVRVRLGDTKGDGIRAQSLELLSPGPGRRQPPCRHFGDGSGDRCGGCTLQHLDEATCTAWTLDHLRRTLARHGLADVPIAPLAATLPGARRRARFAAVRQGARVHLGFNERASHRIVALTACPVLTPRLEALIAPLGRALVRVLAPGGTCDAVATDLDGGVDLLLVGPPALDLAAREALAALAGDADVARLSWQPHERAPMEPVAHRRPVSLSPGGVPVVPPPGAFIQPSAAGEAALTGAVTAALAGAGQVADLYAGIGTFALPLAAGGAAVHAVEADATALGALARAALARAGRSLRITTERRDLDREPLTGTELRRFDAVVCDPPRAGAAAQCAVLAASSVAVVVAVSCNPATFVRDARTLVDGGYVLERIHPVDQFLWSAHLELVGVFRR
jgi:23S rRNA (uracil1939-C5)-methyltransferase